MSKPAAKATATRVRDPTIVRRKAVFRRRRRPLGLWGFEGGQLLAGTGRRPSAALWKRSAGRLAMSRATTAASHSGNRRVERSYGEWFWLGDAAEHDERRATVNGHARAAA